MNPYLPGWEYVPDGEPHVFDGRLYLYGSHDRFGAVRYCDNDYVVWSAPVEDLTAWTSHGVVYRKDQDPSNAERGSALWAPDVARGADGRYYLYYGMEFEPILGVAVAERPDGPFEFLAHVRYPDRTTLGGRPGDVFPFDPAIFVDDDGRVLLYFGFGTVDPALAARLPADRRREGCYVAELADDMVTVVNGPAVIAPLSGHAPGSSFEGHEFYEAASMRRIGDTYYLVYSSINGHELCYATSSRPDGGFRYQGVLVSNGDVGIEGRTADEPLNYIANNHGSLVEVADRWYIFYHRHTNRQQAARQGMAEPILLDAAGRFHQAEMTSSGLRGGPLSGNGRFPASHACVLKSADGAAEMPYYSIDTDSPEPIVFGDRVVDPSHPRLLEHFEKRRDAHPYFTQTGGDREGGDAQYIANMRSGATAGFRYFDLAGARGLSVETSGAEGLLTVSTALDGPVIAEIRTSARGRSSTSALAEGLGNREGLYFTYRGEGAIDFHAFVLTEERP